MRRAHGERGRLLVVERAEALERAGAGAAQRDVLADDLVDPDAVADLRDVAVPDPPCHALHSRLSPTVPGLAPLRRRPAGHASGAVSDGSRTQGCGQHRLGGVAVSPRPSGGGRRDVMRCQSSRSNASAGPDTVPSTCSGPGRRRPRTPSGRPRPPRRPGRGQRRVRPSRTWRGKNMAAVSSMPSSASSVPYDTGPAERGRGSTGVRGGLVGLAAEPEGGGRRRTERPARRPGSVVPQRRDQRVRALAEPGDEGVPLGRGVAGVGTLRGALDDGDAGPPVDAAEVVGQVGQRHPGRRAPARRGRLLEHAAKASPARPRCVR